MKQLIHKYFKLYCVVSFEIAGKFNLFIHTSKRLHKNSYFYISLSKLEPVLSESIPNEYKLLFIFPFYHLFARYIVTLEFINQRREVLFAFL